MSGRGRKKGSKNKKASASAYTQSLRPILSRGLTQSVPELAESDIPDIESDTDNEEESELKEYIQTLEGSIDTILKELKVIQSDLVAAKRNHLKEIAQMRERNKAIEGKCDSMELRITELEQSRDKHTEDINKQERMSRRNNLRIVGYKTLKDENCIEIAKEVFSKVGIEDCKIERAHRDGRIVEGKARHILVKCSFFTDKLHIIRNARKDLEPDPFYIIEDLTKKDLQEKRKWVSKARELYEQGTRVYFLAGCWRGVGGKPYTFSSP